MTGTVEDDGHNRAARQVIVDVGVLLGEYLERVGSACAFSFSGCP